MSTKKAGGTAKNLRDSQPKYLGVKKTAGQQVKLEKEFWLEKIILCMQQLMARFHSEIPEKSALMVKKLLKRR